MPCTYVLTLCVFVCLCMIFGFMSLVGCVSEVLSCEAALEAIFAAELPMFVASDVWLIGCVICFLVLSIMSSWSVSRSELNCGKIELIDAGVLWFIGGGRQILVFSESWIAPCTQIGPQDGCLMEGMCNSSLTPLPLSCLTFNEEGSGFFVSNHFSSLFT